MNPKMNIIYALMYFNFLLSITSAWVVVGPKQRSDVPRIASKLFSTVESEVESSIDVSKVIGNAIFLVPHDADGLQSRFGHYSPVGRAALLEATHHLTQKALWFSDGKIQAKVITLPEEEKDFESIKDALVDTNVLIAFNMNRETDLSFLTDIFMERKSSERKNICHYALECSKEFNPICATFDPESPSFNTALPWTNDASAKRMEEQMLSLFDRWTTDDFTVALMLFFNQYSGYEIDWVKYSIDATWEKGPLKNAEEFVSMVSKCGDCITKCVADENCKKCLDALTAIDTRDQVASYRTIVSYESELLKDFSFCILQKNNIFNCDAKIPKYPKVTPMKTFQGKPLTQQMARAILVGHLDDELALNESKRTDISWKVCGGANVSYDQFPSQNQIFYETVNKKDMWYDPVFRVETIDGRNVWAKRHYRVRDGPAVGTFYFSVLDNGVTSNEFWTLIDVADDLSYIIFHYSGAATAVGQQYIGGLLCTADGSLPPESERGAIYDKLRSCGIQPWELFVVDNDENSAGYIDAGPPPLDFYRKDILAKKKQLNT